MGWDGMNGWERGGGWWVGRCLVSHQQQSRGRVTRLTFRDTDTATSQIFVGKFASLGKISLGRCVCGTFAVWHSADASRSAPEPERSEPKTKKRGAAQRRWESPGADSTLARVIFKGTRGKRSALRCHAETTSTCLPTGGASRRVGVNRPQNLEDLSRGTFGDNDAKAHTSVTTLSEVTQTRPSATRSSTRGRRARDETEDADHRRRRRRLGTGTNRGSLFGRVGQQERW